jgi:hypothetical protein
MKARRDGLNDDQHRALLPHIRANCPIQQRFSAFRP